MSLFGERERRPDRPRPPAAAAAAAAARPSLPPRDRRGGAGTTRDGAAATSDPRRRDDDGGRDAGDDDGRRRGGGTAASRGTARAAIERAKRGRPGRPRHAALLELVYGTTLYVACVFLPSLPRHAYRTYLWGASSAAALRERALWGIWICWRFSLVVLERWGWMEDPYRVGVGREGEGGGEGGGNEGEGGEDGASTARGMRRLGRRITKHIFSTSAASLWEEFNRQEAAGRRPASSPYTWGFGRTTSAHPSILMVLQDVQILIILAILLAVIRVWFVHMLVPEFLAPRRLEAMTRCKSSHLLSSSSYQFGDLKGWEGGSNSNSKERAGARRESPGGRSGEGAEGRGYYERMLAWFSSHWYRLRPSVRRALGHEPSARYDDIVRQQQSPASSSPFRRSDSVPDPARHLFSAPRHATATFRLLYTSASCVSALILFRSAEFWPRPVFGTHPRAGTRHCWDLSGSFSALGFLDDDYDARNGKLKYFFLAQAAYQLHSLCFHVVSMLLLLLYGGDGGGGGNGGFLGRFISRFRRGETSKHQQHQSSAVFQQQKQEQAKSIRLISMKTSMQSYFRPMMEHVMVLALLVGAYLFSGLRRLGAVGIFTLELSSVSLQLLQVCIYAPETSRWRRPGVVRFVHRTLTVPTFVYCRLVIMPFVLWRSALFESQEWLEQIAKVFSPGWAERLYTMFNGSLCLIFVLNLVLFRRLLFHPHLKQIVKQ